jgi:phosphotriesterase-related protein
MNGRITTVKGDIAAAELGFCQPHEHLFIAAGPAAEADPQLLIDDIDKTETDVAAFRDAGGHAVVDAQPAFTGRDATALLRISGDCGVHVIASTGFHKLFYYGYDGGDIFLGLGEETLADAFASEIETGMYAAPFYSPDIRESARTQAGGRGSSGKDGENGTPGPPRTGILAGVIKTALEPEFTELHAKLFGAAAKASGRTGAAVMIHVDRGADPLRLAHLLDARGVRPERTIYCHLDRATDDTGVYRALAESGAYIEYDTVARPKYHTDEAEADIVTDMLKAGFTDRIMISLDVTRARLRGYGGTPGLDHLLVGFIPFLKKHGVDDAQLRAVFSDNPARALARA